MKSLTVITVCACLALLAAPAWGQAASSNAGSGAHGIAGYLDPQTGNFKPMHAQQTSAPPPSNPPTQGTFIVGLTVDLVTNFPSEEVFTCAQTIEVFDVMSGLDFLETASVAGNRSGSTLTCTTTIPYSWRLTDPSGDTVSVSFSVQASGPASSGGQPTRSTTQTVVSAYPVPPQNKTTTFNLGAVM
jgi:hypothetical protein